MKLLDRIERHLNDTHMPSTRFGRRVTFSRAILPTSRSV